MALASAVLQFGNYWRVAPALLRYRPFVSSSKPAANLPEPVSGSSLGRRLRLRDHTRATK